MFSFFVKNSISLLDLIPEDSVDIHCHVLPGVDDGAKNIDESKDLINSIKKIGFSKIIATPHIYPGLFDNNKKSIQKAYDKIKNKFNFSNLQLDYACEYLIHDSLIVKARNKKLICLSENYVLIEFSYLNKNFNTYEIIYELVVNGYRPILAHPERYLFLKDKLDYLHELKKRGVLLQMNLLSLIGFYGFEVSKMANILLQNKLIDFVGTDIHNNNHIHAIINKKINLKTFDKVYFNEIFEKTNSTFKNSLKYN